MNNSILRFSALALALTVLGSCGGGGGGGSAAPGTASWTGTKQLGAAGAKTRATGVAVDSSGNVYVAGYTTGGLDNNTLTGIQDYFVTAYDSVGNKMLTRQVGATGTTTQANGIAVDKNGNVYVAGYTTGGLDGNALTGLSDFFVTMYDSSGKKVRTRQFGVAGAVTQANSVAVDKSGNVYVAGYTAGGLDGNLPAGFADFFVTQYDSSGNRVRTRQLGVAGAVTRGNGVAVDSSGNVYVTGVTNGGLDGNTLIGNEDFFMTMYDSSGNKVRTEENGPTGGTAWGWGVAVDSHQNAFVAGYSLGALDGNTLTGLIDYFVTAYDSSGNKVRTKQNGALHGRSSATGVAVDSSGNVYVAGFTTGALDNNTYTGVWDFFLTKYDSLGNKVLTRQRGVAGATTQANGVAVDSSGNVYAAGYTTGGLDGNTLTGLEDFFLMKFDSSGNKQ